MIKRLLNPFTKFTFRFNYHSKFFFCNSNNSKCSAESIITDSSFHVSGLDIDNIKGAKKGDHSHYVISFECKICNVRNTKMCTKNAYHKGLVLIKCDGCKSNHLIADNLGWVKDKDQRKTLEEILKDKGEEVKRININDMISNTNNNKTNSNESNTPTKVSIKDDVENEPIKQKENKVKSKYSF